MPIQFQMPDNLPFAKIRSTFGLLSAIDPSAKTAYEELTCVGYHPDREELHGVVAVKQAAGYMGDVCSTGSPEFVRFYMSFDGGATWEDKGVASFQAHDLGQAGPTEYAVTLRIDLPEKPCKNEAQNMAKVRAILSWRDLPPPNTPGFSPRWGNRLEVDVQLKPSKPALTPILPPIKIKPLGTVLSDLKPLPLHLPIAAKALVNKPRIADLVAKYGAKVPAHRTVFPEMTMLAKASSGAISNELVKSLGDLKLDPKVIGDAIIATVGDTQFEQLTCVGFDPKTESLVGVIHVKLPNGYSGSLCDLGSKEYVAFWVDWGDGRWNYVGTSFVTAHDISSMPAGGLRYALSQRLDMSGHRNPCGEGANIVRVRAILSWQDAPSTTDPNYPPRWGNRLEGKIEIPPREKTTTGALWRAAGRVALDDIEPPGHANQGYTKTGQHVATIYGGRTYFNAPFGGFILLQGLVPAGARYRFMFRKVGVTSFAPLLSNLIQPTTVYQWVPGTATRLPVTLTCDSQGYYTALNDVDEDILGVWFTGPQEDEGLFELYMQVQSDGLSDTAPDGRRVVAIRIDNSAPTAELVLDGAGSGMCTDTNKGDPVRGKFTASARHFASFGFELLPPIPAGLVGTSNPASIITISSPSASGSPTAATSYPSLPTGGVPTLAGTFELNTSNMQPCGYSLTIIVNNRVNVNSGSYREDREHVGFCVRPKP
ncbi:MAG: hypothetical protein IPK82_37005 [Polyangiaceae bacterium]|nr:hypothetical protein [Polyangiaceae bacterium]